MVNQSKNKALGRGLSFLIGDQDADVGGANVPGTDLITSNISKNILPIEKIHPNVSQPRRNFDEEALQELTASIMERGLIQPIVVRKSIKVEGEYEIVAGERRWRAAQRASLYEVPVVIKNYSDNEVLEISIIENIQRVDFNPIEEAQAFKQLIENCNYTQEQLSDVLSKSRSHIANTIRLLNLPLEIQNMIRDGHISSGHARALINADNPVALAERVIKEKLNVRQLEALVKSKPQVEPSKARTPNSRDQVHDKDADLRALELDIMANLDIELEINHNSKSNSGQVVLYYKDMESLDRICNRLSFEKNIRG